MAICLSTVTGERCVRLLPAGGPRLRDGCALRGG